MDEIVAQGDAAASSEGQGQHLTQAGDGPKQAATCLFHIAPGPTQFARALVRLVHRLAKTAEHAGKTVLDADEHLKFALLAFSAICHIL